jgi:hypothetical protein
VAEISMDTQREGLFEAPVPARNATCLILLRFEEGQAITAGSIRDAGRVLWCGKGGFEVIGRSGDAWDIMLIFACHSSDGFRLLREHLASLPLRRVAMYQVELMPAWRLRLFQFLMKHAFSRRKVDLALRGNAGGTIPDVPILPRREQLDALRRRERGEPLVMLNLLKYFPVARYPPGFAGRHAPGETGEAAYSRRYGLHVMKVSAKLGCCIELAGKVVRVLLGAPGESWDDFAMMWYPDGEAFNTLFSLKATQEGAAYRDAGLERTQVIAISPGCT